MKDTAAADNYARALFGAVQGKKSPGLESVSQQLSRAAAHIAGQPRLYALLQNPLLTPAKKKQKLKEETAAFSAEFPPELARFLDLVVSKKRVSLLPLIARRFEILVEESQGRIRAQVRSAAPLDDKTKKEIEASLFVRFRKKAVLETSVDSDLLAGMVVRVGDLVIDNSLKTQLNHLRNRIAGG